ncbi:hypothetical protein C8J57DRAFT_1232903 [Mycena rebaudengoi]|nr:hypothetical protein C8J57DRAFT_1232903 [Mycena rebaudengoi]
MWRMSIIGTCNAVYAMRTEPTLPRGHKQGTDAVEGVKKYPLESLLGLNLNVPDWDTLSAQEPPRPARARRAPAPGARAGTRGARSAGVSSACECCVCGGAMASAGVEDTGERGTSGRGLRSEGWCWGRHDAQGGGGNVRGVRGDEGWRGKRDEWRKEAGWAGYGGLGVAWVLGGRGGRGGEDEQGAYRGERWGLVRRRGDEKKGVRVRKKESKERKERKRRKEWTRSAAGWTKTKPYAEEEWGWVVGWMSVPRWTRISGTERKTEDETERKEGHGGEDVGARGRQNMIKKTWKGRNGWGQEENSAMTASGARLASPMARTYAEHAQTTHGHEASAHGSVSHGKRRSLGRARRTWHRPAVYRTPPRVASLPGWVIASFSIYPPTVSRSVSHILGHRSAG